MNAVTKSNEPSGKPQGRCVADAEVDAKRVRHLGLACVSDGCRSNIDGVHPGAKPGKLSRIRAFAAPDIQPVQPVDRRQHR
jgi:hypothetical protein